MSPDARVAVVTDSTSYLPAELVREHGIEVVPLQVVIGGTSYDEGSGASPGTVAEALRSWQPVTTSRPAPATLLQAYTRGGRARLRRRWCRCTCRRRCPGPSSRRGWRPRSRRCRPRWSTPGRSGMGLGFAVVSAAIAAAEGRPADEVARAARDRADASSAVFYVDTLEYLRRGGRIGAAAAMLGSALAVKPLLHLVDGHIEALEKVRTSAKAIARLEEVAVGKAGSRTVDVAVHHLASADRADALAGRLRGRLSGLADLHVSEVGAVVGAHVGPGMLAVVVAPR